MRTTADWAVRILLLSAFAVWPVSSSRAWEGAPPSDDALAAVAAGNTAFGLDLYHRIGQPDENIVVSPYSLSSALAMTYAGARGETEAQMAKVLRFSRDQDDLHAAFKSLDARIRSNRDVILRSANALWAEKRFPFRQAFMDQVTRAYRAQVEHADFEGGADAVALEINEWVLTQTEQKIRDLIAPGVLNSDTRLVLVNAIYFKGLWVNPFDKARTCDASFWRAGGQEIKVPTMNGEEEFAYMEDAALQMLALPYVGRGLEMLVLLPRDRDGLAALEASLTAEQLSAWISQLSFARAIVYLPRFRFEAAFSLADKLSQMGMPDAFAASADFSGMTDAGTLAISAVLHKAFVEVNEEGTEAAAASAVAMYETGAAMQDPVEPKIFRADHPFVFVIREKQTGSVLFIGRVADPRASPSEDAGDRR